MWDIQPQEAIGLINRDSAVVFDIRDVARYEQGHIIGAKNVQFNPATDDPKATLKITPQTTCVFVCNIGQSSGRAVHALREKGFENIYNLAGGMAAWQKENLPVVAKSVTTEYSNVIISSNRSIFSTIPTYKPIRER